MEKDVYVKIGERLRKQRRIMGLTQEQAARILHVSQVQVSRLERRSLQKLREYLSD